MFSGWGLKGLDGTAWYHPQRLTIDSGAVAAGNANPAQKVLDVRATHGDDLPRNLRIYAFGAALGGQRVLDAASALAKQSHIPKRNLTLVDRHAHLRPQRPELGRAEERVREEPAAVPAEDCTPVGALRRQPLPRVAHAEPAGVVWRELEADRALVQVVLLVVEQIHERALPSQLEPRAGIASGEVVHRHHGGPLPVAPLS